MQVNNNLSPIPFYFSEVEQDRRKWYAYSDVFRLYVPNDHLLPFFIHIPKDNPDDFWNSLTIHIFRICDCRNIEAVGHGASFNLSFSNDFAVGTGSGNTYADIMANNAIQIIKGVEYDTLIYYATPIAPPPITTNIGLPNGEYYFRMDFTMDGVGGISAYSDVFTVVEPKVAKQKVKVEWHNEEPLEYKGGYIPYGDVLVRPGLTIKYRNAVYLDTDIAMPEYTFTDEGEERNGYFYPTRQISEKAYKMRFTAPEYLCDAMRLIRMADYVQIEKQLANIESETIVLRAQTYDVEQFEMDVEWLEQGHYADVQCSFKTDTIVKKIGKAYNV